MDEKTQDFNDDHMEVLTHFVQSIPGFQERDSEDIETWMACDVEHCGFKMLNDVEIIAYVLEESDPIDDKIDEDEERSKGPSNADAFSELEKAKG
ncbi:UNVERIFIED_CONTAM: hypothetical protein NCL1_39752 [Trichonephila clavipes]